ncbi:MAG: hypothetical protein E6R03_05040 [Hyphomicrobiaceae bacterium]|nr:MAG: hypothetical protein E6R03_05040 [Hyphomicrobiaceae bacterium]
MLDDIFRLPSCSDSLLNVVGLASASLSRQLQASVEADPTGDQPLSEYDTGDVEGYIRFCKEVLDFHPWSKQIEIAKSYFENVRTAARSGHSVGKTSGVASICVYHFAVRRKCFYTTAPGAAAVNDGLWKEIRKLYNRALRKLPGKVQESPCIKTDDPGWWGKGFATNKAERAQGRHEVDLLVVADEAAGVEEFIWDALESSMASEGVRMVIIGNPNTQRGTFYHAFHEAIDQWHNIHVSSMDSPNITGTEPGVPGLATLEWVEAQRVRYKDKPDVFRCRILGEWPMSDGAEKIIPMDFILEAQKLWLELEEEEEYYDEEPDIHCAFLDVASWGVDHSALAYLRGQRFHIALEDDDRSDEGLMKLAEATNDWVCGLPAHQKPKWIAVDCDAVGGGPFSRLTQLRKENLSGWGRCRIVKFHWGGGASAKKKKQYNYQIDECHDELRKALDPSKPRCERLAIPPDKRVAAQLNTRKFTLDRLEKVRVETKAELGKRRAGSLDLSDAIVGCMHEPKITGCKAA